MSKSSSRRGISGVLFDYGGVIMPNPPLPFQEISRVCGLSVRTVERLLLEHLPSLQKGTLSEESLNDIFINEQEDTFIDYAKMFRDDF